MLLNLSRTAKELLALGVPMKFSHIQLLTTVVYGAQGHSGGFLSMYAICESTQSEDIYSLRFLSVCLFLQQVVLRSN